MKFPRPWRMEQTGHTDCVITDANGLKLFYVVGDEGDGEDAKPSVLFWGNDTDTLILLNEIKEMLK